MKILLRNERGVALLMVMGFVAILTALLADFSFETTVNSLKAYNSQDQVQARLNAESGLNFAMAQLRIYQEARNLLEKNESAKSVINPSILENVLTQPFVYPIPLPGKASASQKSALSEFEKESFLSGQFQFTIMPVRGFLNPNNLRISPPPAATPGQPTPVEPPPQDQDQDGANKTPQQYMEEQITQVLINAIERMKEEDDPFLRENPNLEPRMLVKELKFYVNNPQLMQDPEKFEIISMYNQDDVIPKHAPLTSIHEMRYLIGWPDYLLDKVIDQLTVHEVSFIALNELTENSLRLLFPNVTPEQIEEFFRFRDGDEELGEEPQPFRSVDDFKNLVVSRLAIVNESEFQDREKEFAAANLRFGVAGKLYRVISIGQYNTAKVTLTAYVDLPVKDPPPATPAQPGQPNPAGDQTGDDPDDADNPDQDPDQDPQDQPGQTPQTPTELPLELLPPRIIEVQVD